MKSSYASLRRRRGLTLVELLVVVVILVMLVAVTIPLMRSVRSGSELEAAVRKIESIINDALTRAIVTGRPAGITFIRDPLSPGVAYQVALAESPPPYAGDVVNARAIVKKIVDSTTNLVVRTDIEFSPNEVRKLRSAPKVPEDELTWFVRPGDTIRFNYRGAAYPIRAVPDYYVVALDPNVPLADGQFVSFQIQRAPRRSLATPIELPQGSFVVLKSSGVAYDSEAIQLDKLTRLFSTGDFTVAFNASGDVDRIYRGTPMPNDIADGLSEGLTAEQAQQRVIPHPLTPIRIDLAGGSLQNPANAMRLIVKNGRVKRKSSPIDPTDLVQGPLAVPDGIALGGGGDDGGGTGDNGNSSGSRGG